MSEKESRDLTPIFDSLKIDLYKDDLDLKILIAVDERTGLLEAVHTQDDYTLDLIQHIKEYVLSKQQDVKENEGQ